MEKKILEVMKGCRPTSCIEPTVSVDGLQIIYIYVYVYMYICIYVDQWVGQCRDIKFGTPPKAAQHTIHPSLFKKLNCI